MTAPNNLNAVKLEFFDRLVCDPRVRGADCRVAWRLVCRSNDDLTSCPTCRIIARELECSVRTVKRRRKLKADPPRNWTGVWVMTTK